MSMKSGLDGVTSAINTLNKISKNEEKAIKGFLSIASKELETSIKRKIQSGARTGITYQKYNPKRKHQASAIGEPPKTDTGRLVNSIDGRMKDLTADVFSNIKYAIMLEFGTSKMKARPVWQPTFEELKPKFSKGFTKAINSVIKQEKLNK